MIMLRRNASAYQCITSFIHFEEKIGWAVLLECSILLNKVRLIVT